MDKILATLQTTLQRWDLHPVVDHFTISLLVVGVLIDLIANLAPTRIWLRYTALSLMILGAIAAGASYFTGGLEANRVFDAMSEPAKQIFGHHAKLGDLHGHRVRRARGMEDSDPGSDLLRRLAIDLFDLRGHLGGSAHLYRTSRRQPWYTAMEWEPR